MNDAQVGEPARVLFRRLIGRFDLHHIDRDEWRDVCGGTERAAMQSFLLEMAGAARIGSDADRLALLKAAYAVLPLHGTDLNELADLLIREPTPHFDYADALMEALAQQPAGGSRLGAGILATLRRLCEGGTPPKCAEWIRFHVNALGYAII